MFRSEGAVQGVEAPERVDGTTTPGAPASSAAPGAASPSAVVAALQDGTTLRALAGLSAGAPPTEPELMQAAQAQIAQFIDAGSISFEELRAGGYSDALLSIAGQCSDPSRLAVLLDGADPHRLVSLVTDGSSSRIRQGAAQRIMDPAQLRHLLKQVRGKDKNVYKIIKQKCDELRTEEQKSVQVETDAAAACASLERHSHRIYDAVYEATLEHFAGRWRTLETHAAPEIQERARHAIDRCKEIIAEHVRQAAHFAERQALEEAKRAAQAESLARAQQEAQQLEQTAAAAAAAEKEARLAEERERAAQSTAEANVSRRLAGLVAKTHSALRDGDTGRAAGLRRAIEEGMSAFPAVPMHLSRMVAQLDTKLNELKKWKDFAVAPKRAELIVEMEALIGSSEPPKALAERIKQLQDEWKVISKGIVSDSQADWQRFHQAADTAFQPCRAYFEAQARQRQANLQQRQALLERLKNFEASQAGDNRDWRSVAVVLREARLEWRRHSPVDRAAAAKLQKEFDSSIQRLQEALDGWYAENFAEKKSLIERARHLVGKPDNREAIETAKHLQQLWKKVGVVEREQEQSLWNEFREQCDAVFAKRQQAQVEFSAALEANKGAALALCQEVEQAASLGGQELVAAAAKASQWRSAFDAIGELPRAEQRALHTRFESALKACQARVADMRARDRQQAFDHLLEAGRYIQAYGCAVAQDAASTERDALRQAAETFIAGVQHWPKGAAPLLKEAWQKAETATSAQLAANDKALRILCIRSEIFNDRPTPPEDQALRREYQMQRLTQRMGQRSEEDSDAWEALALAWVRIGPSAAAEYQALLARFTRYR
jgi:Domain of Unknown Function (DUF349)